MNVKVGQIYQFKYSHIYLIITEITTVNKHKVYYYTWIHSNNSYDSYCYEHYLDNNYILVDEIEI